jgi:hypothetical protein
MDFPLQLRFKVVAVAPQITVTDAAGRLVFYVKQKAFKLKEDVTVFADTAQTQPLFRIKADRVLDISASYHIEDRFSAPVGAHQRKGMKSIWKAHYEIHREGMLQMTIQEENPWIKLLDGLIGEIPILGLFSGYFLHPSYLVSRGGAAEGDGVLRLRKQAAFFEGIYSIERLGALDERDETLAVLSILMMVLLERSRG